MYDAIEDRGEELTTISGEGLFCVLPSLAKQGGVLQAAIRLLKASLNMADIKEMVLRLKREGRDYRQFRTMVLQDASKAVISVCCFKAHPSTQGVELLAFATIASSRKQGYGRLMAIHHVFTQQRPVL